MAQEKLKIKNTTFPVIRVGPNGSSLSLFLSFFIFIPYQVMLLQDTPSHFYFSLQSSIVIFWHMLAIIFIHFLSS